MKTFLSILISIVINDFYCQEKNNNLLGLWQAKTHEISSGYYETYQFFQEGNFIFTTNEYEGLRRIIALFGKYCVQNDTLTLTITDVTEIKDGNIIMSEFSTLNGGWEIDKGTLIKNSINSIVQKLTFERIINIEKKVCLKINGQIFYLVNTNPFSR